MNSYGSLTMDNLRVLDFTSSKVEPEHEKAEHPVLDLSCKKPSITTNFPPVHHETFSNSSNCSNSNYNSNYNSSNEEQSQATNLSPSPDRKGSPFEVRTFMVTPPSEPESPKRPKYEPVYTPINVPSLDHLGHRIYPPLPMNLPHSVVPSGLPPLIVQHNNNNNINAGTQIQMPNATSTTQDLPPTSTYSDCNKNAPRPFKAYPKDPLSLSVVPELIYDQNSNEAYSEFRRKMLDSVRRTSEGTNIKMRRISKSPGLPTSTFDEKDSAYWERRRKNNEAAKRSRDARRAKEDEIAIRAAFLEQENMKLKYELVALRNETAKLRCMIYSN